MGAWTAGLRGSRLGEGWQGVKELKYGKSDTFCEFLTHLERGEPVVLRGMGQAERWSALKVCTPSGLKKLVSHDCHKRSIGNLRVDVALNVEERSGCTKKARVRLRDFVHKLHACDLEHGGKSVSKDNDMGYLKQIQCDRIFGDTKELLDPVKTLWPDAICPTGYFWAGPSGCTTGCHSDDEKNILVQLYGKKRVTLVPEAYKSYLYTNSKYDSGTTCCDVDIENPDLHKHPLFKKVIAAGAVRTVTLDAGDVLYIPKNVFHQVTSETISVSMNFFCSNWWEWIFDGVPRAVGICMHELGLYKAEHCVCHPHKSVGFACSPV